MGEFASYLAGRWTQVLGATVEHAVLVLGALALATLIGVPLAIAIYRTDTPRTAVLAVTGLFLTIPSYALFGLLIAPFGLGTTPALIALTMYALLPIIRNAVVGLRGVPPAVREAAVGIGMGRTRRLLRIELPLAWPVIITGLRISAQLLLGIAAIAAAVNGPGLGKLIMQGLAKAGTPFAAYLVLAGIIGIVVLALVFEAGFNLLHRFTTPREAR